MEGHKISSKKKLWLIIKIAVFEAVMIFFLLTPKDMELHYSIYWIAIGLMIVVPIWLCLVAKYNRATNPYGNTKQPDFKVPESKGEIFFKDGTIDYGKRDPITGKHKSTLP